jgi:hypothetical protein
MVSDSPTYLLDIPTDTQIKENDLQSAARGLRTSVADIQRHWKTPTVGRAQASRTRFAQSKPTYVSDSSTHRTHQHSIHASLTVLGLNPDENWTVKQITKQYHTLARKYHPDKQSDKHETEKQAAADQFVRLKEAYQYLKEFPST